ncbi:MAG: biotin--[acetyl-CoA-carboxylase] ligase [Planctomycetes bacterium]|nr:biotin--[acetyl-CoA-carboxylase] ligase [Planctomycetota bacterium]
MNSLMRDRTRFARFVHVASCTSTQDLALADHVTENGARPDAVYIADHQTSGRGRQQREWHDEPGADLLATFRFRQQLPAPSALPAALPVAATLALEPFARRKLRIKWPNDIYLDGRKLCGMLIDSGVAGSDTYLVGIGVNCNRVRFPPDLESMATSLALANGEEIDRAQLLLAIAESIDAMLRQIAAGHHDELLAVFRDRLGLLGRAVEVNASEVHRGRLTAIDFAELRLDGQRRLPLGFVRGIRPARPH